jgi:hypothetical protein
MPIRSKKGAKPRVTKTPTIEPQAQEAAGSPPAEQPLVDEWSQLRSEFAAIIAKVPKMGRSRPVTELIQSIEYDLMHPRDFREELSWSLAWLVTRLEDEKRAKADRRKWMRNLMSGRSPETED